MTSGGRRSRSRPREAAPRGTSLVGSTLLLDVGPVAHGGFCVARHEGRVVFVRHTLPDERVRARVTEGGTGDRFLRADAVEVLTPSPHRVPSPCPYAVPGGCGGCDWQHADLAYQRSLKAAVVAEALRRLAGLDVPVTVDPLPGLPEGLGWRTRVRLAVAPDGRAGFRRHRSHEVVPVDRCAIAHPALQESGVLERTWAGADSVDVVVPSAGSPVVVSVPASPVPEVTERVEAAGWCGEFHLGATDFWQVHPGAAKTFVDRVLADLAPRPGERVLDLYAGVGLFALALAAAVGPSGAVVAVEADPAAAAHGARNATAYPNVRFQAGAVQRVLPTLEAADLVVLDPPRAGAGKAVLDAVAALRPRAIEYVACDPATLARDLRFAADLGYRLASLHAYDAFPMTHHVECLALLVSN